MSVFYTRVNLNSAIFPFYTEAAGRTIIVPEYDENWDRNNAANTSPEKGVPQVYYMHNVMPKAGGFQSVGYNVVLSQFGPPNVTNFDQAFSLQSTDNSNVLFVPASGINYVYDAQVGNYWTSVSPITGSSILTSQTVVTTALINGQTYFCYAGYGTFYYNTSTKLMVRVVWVNAILNDATILGITASNGYMIAWTKTALFWSSLVNPLDFTPSIQTGAGGGALQYARGNINFCLPIGGGFIVYCAKNAVGSSYTNNSQYPWIFQEITDSGGCFDPNQVAAGTNLDTHYAMTTNGLQGINRTQAQSVFPEVTDFLSLRLFEDFSNGVFSESLLGAPLYTKLAAVENRFLVFSYGQTQAAFTHAIVFDLTLGRYGKLKINHTHCFQYNYPNLYLGATYGQLLAAGTTYAQLSNTTYAQLSQSITVQNLQKTSLAFLQSSGVVSLVDFGLNATVTDSVFILGKYQFKRNNLLVHQTTEIETISNISNFTFSLLYTLDGKTINYYGPGVLIYSGAGGCLKYGSRVTGKNISLLLQGQMDLTTAVLTFTTAGFR